MRGRRQSPRRSEEEGRSAADEGCEVEAMIVSRCRSKTIILANALVVNTFPTVKQSDLLAFSGHYRCCHYRSNCCTADAAVITASGCYRFTFQRPPTNIMFPIFSDYPKLVGPDMCDN